MRGTQPLLFDAYHYWLGAQHIVGTSPEALENYWELRGVWTSIVYAPAAALTRLMGAPWATFAVLLQNTLVLSWFAAHLLPTLASRLAPWSPRARWIAAGLLWVVTSGFASSSLVDIYAAIGCFAIVALIRSQRPSTLVLAGVLGGIVVNLRPAYVVVVALIVLITLISHKMAAIGMPLGFALALAPQVILNIGQFGHRSASPLLSDYLATLQAGLGSYTIRYDTVHGSDVPQQFYCSPDMAARVADDVPTSTAGLARTLLSNLPDSLVFSLEKIAAALHWPANTPYGADSPGLDAIHAILITTMTVVGISVLARTFRRRSDWTDGRQVEALGFLAILIGAVVAIVGSATEARFALPLAVLGALGCALLSDNPLRTLTSSQRRWIGVTCATLAITLTLGYIGLSNPADPGGVDAEICGLLG